MGTGVKSIYKQREIARDQVKKVLEENGKCAFIRPTGWGKTWTTASLVDDYENVLYLYPSKTIMNTFLYAYYTLKLQEVKTSIPGVTLLSYDALRRMKPERMKKFKNLGLIIMDECDILGAPETMRAASDLIAVAKKAKLLGATATPERQDMIDEIAIFFDDHVIADYSLKDALDDEILQRPYYVSGCYDETTQEILEKMKKKTALEVDKMSHESDKKLLGAYISARQLECAKLLNMENVIPEELEKAGLDSSYQKYIVFFPSFKMIKKQSNMVRNWFRKAFPDHEIHEIVVTSETQETRDNVDLLSTLNPRDSVIHLIYTCNMMNMGYHVNTLTGIIMLRGTGSSHIYIQQLGRVLSTGSLKPGIVFDVVDNLHRPAQYQMCWETSQGGGVTEDGEVVTDTEIQEYEELVQKTRVKDENNRPVQLTAKERKRLIQLKKKIHRLQTGKTGYSTQFTPEDFNVSARTATVRELIAKTVAEPISMRCRQAWSRWVEKGGDASCLTKEFILSQKAPDATPLPPFCKLKHVSVEAVLNEMGVV